MPPRAKKSAANQHDKRHENGLAPPGKRIPRQKSNQNLNGSANGKTASTPPPLPPADVVHHSQTFPPATPNGAVYAPTPADATMAGGSAARPHDGRHRSMSDLSLDARPSPTAYAFDGSHGAPDAARPLSPRRLDANANSHHNVSSAYRGNALTIATTILASCPLQDVIAILIILLQLGPTALTIVHFLYAALTFVPPTSPTSLSTLPSLTDMFQGSGGSPSLGLIVFVDVFILIIWLLLWVPLQNFILDLAQAVIAISLGGAAAGGGGTTNSMILCIGIILASNFGRCGFLRQHLSSLLSTALSKGGIQGFRPVEQSPVNRSACYSPHGWVRSLLGVHILAQGILRLIRRTLSRREQQQSLAASKKVDPESGVALQLARRNSACLDPNADQANASSTDGRPPGLPPVSKEKEKAQNSKKKRRQATHVRSQQPFWAAIASTKVTVLKEMEQSHAANDADEATAWDMNHVGNSAFKSEGDSVWISNVGATEIAFGARLFRGAEPQQQENGEPGLAGIDKNKPFYVRLNGAVWSSTRIREISTNGCVEDGAIISYRGEIHGLTAFSNYHVEFVRVGTDEVLNSASLITSPSPSTDTASSSSPASRPTLRPASPTTTLKKSIAAAEQQLHDTRNRLKKNKKDHKSTVTSLKREVEGLNGRLSGSGSTDDRQRQRILQLERDIKQAKESAVEVEQEIHTLGDIPEEEHDEHCAQRQAWLKEKNREASELESLERLKTEASRGSSQVQSDITSAAQKRERLIARQTKLLEQHERLVAAKAEGKSVKDRKAAERAALALHRAAIDQQYRTTIDGWERDALSYSHRRLQMEQQIQYLDALHQQLQQAPHHPIPPTPEGVLPGTTLPGTSGISGPTAFPAFQFPPLHIPPNINQRPSSFRGGRGRSSSMLSEVSGFTDELDDGMHHPASAGPYMVQPEWPINHSAQGSRPASGFFPGGLYGYWPTVNGINGTRKGSGGSGSASASVSTSTTGSGSGSGSINGSQRDPLSPVPASVSSVATVTMSPTTLGMMTPWNPGGRQ